MLRASLLLLGPSAVEGGGATDGRGSDKWRFLGSKALQMFVGLAHIP